MSHSSSRKDLGISVRRTNYIETFPDIKKPHPIGFFSINADRSWEPNETQLRYFKKPSADKFPLDLNVGLSQAVKKPESARTEYLDHLLKFIYDHHSAIFGNEQIPEFIAWRGLLRLIMCTPYEYRQDWMIHVTRFNNTLYLAKKETEQEIYQRAQESELQKTLCAYGFKLEQYCLSESPFGEPDPSAPVNECEEFSLAYNTRLGGMNLLYGAEMDGIMSETAVQLNYDKPILDNLKFIEIKVRQGNLNDRQYTSYLRHKTKNWWCQSFLVGIEDIYVGMRNDKGLVKSVEHIETRSLPKNGAENYWQPAVCVDFLQQFLARIKSLMANENCPYTTYEFYFNASTGRIDYERLEGKTENSFIPDWYINLMQRHSKKQNIQN